MRKIAVLVMFVMITLCASQGSAALNDTRASISAQYGEYRLVVDTDNQLWTKAEWESGGIEKAKAGAYIYYFTRNGVNIQMEVNYDGTKPDSPVRAQRITPDQAIQINKFFDYFPEFRQLFTGPKANAFATYQELTRNFRDEHSPVTLGILVKEPLVAKKSCFTLIAFNIKDAGRLVKDPKFINQDLYVHEFTLERILRLDADDPATAGGHDWEWLKNPFK